MKWKKERKGKKKGKKDEELTQNILNCYSNIIETL